MQSHPEEAFPEVKKEEESHLGGDSSPKVNNEEESHLGGDSFPKVNNEEVSHSGDASPEVKKEEYDFIEPISSSHLENTPQEPANVSTLEEEEDEDDDDVQIIEDENELYDNASNQLVLYNPEANGVGEIVPAEPEPIDYHPPPMPTYAPNPPSRILPCVGAFTVQCANCFKWRFIPTKEKYEEIRESILQEPFVCERAREWRPDITCDDPADISQDGSRLWAIDKPNIAQPPRGWERLLRIRGEGSTKFADVYYVAPSGKRLRSMVEVQKFLVEHPEYITAGVTMSQFSFQIPKPLQENYVRKRPARVQPSYDATELAEVNPLSWASPVGFPETQNDEPGLSTQYVVHPGPPPKKKRSTKSPSKRMHYNSNEEGYIQPGNKVEEEPQPSRSSSYDV